jgi:phosphatidylglycerol:prolipoprotein diacylglycerol transferase
MLTFPAIDPIALKLGPLAIRWYSLAYISGIVAGWWIVTKELAKHPLPNLDKKRIDDMIMWAIGGIILGGRIGYCLFYKPDYYLTHPVQILHVWEGGMSFHGGFLGFITAFYIFCRRNQIPYLRLMDLMAVVAPIGIGLGRMANFINGELWGRVTDASWGMVFPTGGALPRHPSQLYEAACEGALLLLIMMILLKCTKLRERTGALIGCFLVGYGCARIGCEFFREPDDYLGFLFAGATMGQLLSVPMVIAGIIFLARAKRHAP